MLTARSDPGWNKLEQARREAFLLLKKHDRQSTCRIELNKAQTEVCTDDEQIKCTGVA